MGGQTGTVTPQRAPLRCPAQVRGTRIATGTLIHNSPALRFGTGCLDQRWSKPRRHCETMLGDFAAFGQLGIVFQSNSLASTDRLSLDAQGNSAAYDLPPFTTLDGAVGIGRDSRQLQLYGQNLTDTRAQLFENSAQNYAAITVNRPRTVACISATGFAAISRETARTMRAVSEHC